MKIVIANVSESRHQVVKSYCLKSLSATQFTQDGKTFIFWPFTWFNDNRKLVKQFAMTLKNFIPATDNKVMRVTIKNSDLDIFAPEKTISFINLINYLKENT